MAKISEDGPEKRKIVQKNPVLSSICLIDSFFYFLCVSTLGSTYYIQCVQAHIFSIQMARFQVLTLRTLIHL